MKNAFRHTAVSVNPCTYVPSFIMVNDVQALKGILGVILLCLIILVIIINSQLILI
ncbi:MAG: hypothetical protein ACI32N_06500 [Bulleidia sp.]